MIFHDRPARIQHEEARRADHQRGAQVGLAHDQPHRQRDSTAATGNRASAAPFAPLEVPREHQRQRDLHELRRLEARDAEVEPAARAVDHRAAERHRDQQQDADDIERHRGPRELLRRDVGDDPHQHQCEAQRQRLAGHACDALSDAENSVIRPMPTIASARPSGAVDAARDEIPEPGKQGERFLHAGRSVGFVVGLARAASAPRRRVLCPSR